MWNNERSTRRPGTYSVIHKNSIDASIGPEDSGNGKWLISLKWKKNFFFILWFGDHFYLVDTEHKEEFKESNPKHAAGAVN